MIELDYQISSSSPERRSSVDLACADEGTLHYELFLGDVCLRVENADFSTDWGWVPVLDFALGLVRVIRSLAPGTCEVFEFTESEASLYFTRSIDDQVVVSANYSSATATVSYGELLNRARGFLRRVVIELQNAYPALTKNPSFDVASREVID